ncbi:MAG: L-2-hydroxyglutarate oxidase [Actinomycetota bacterium]|nr:L-2-hydroxyglutarate oxidase [Actinomycetota bacterium]
MSDARVGIIGAGIIGLAVARRLQQVAPDTAVVVLDKELSVAAHQTGHNSGVVHAGLYYTAGSLKAELCRKGGAQIRDYCTERALPYDECGKLVIACRSEELGRLRKIDRQARLNGVAGLSWLDAGGIAQIEPHATGVAALHSPHTAIADFAAVARSFADDVRGAGGSVELGRTVTAIEGCGERVAVRVGGDEMIFDGLIVCAGLQSDRLARLAGDDHDPVIVPFRGEYFRLRPSRTGLVRGLIYPVPDPAYPFLGVHFTRRVDGGVDIGPNAVVALSREGYRRRQVRLCDVADIVASVGFRRLARRHWRTGAREALGSLSRRAFLASARRYVPELSTADVERGPSGVRAQAVEADGTLLDDFRIGRVGPVVTVRNAPSPAATSSMAIADHIVDSWWRRR